MDQFIGAGVMSRSWKLCPDSKLYSLWLLWEVPFFPGSSLFQKILQHFFGSHVRGPSRLFAEGSNFTLQSQLKHDEKQ